ncbi:hypothetical protein JXA47_00690 [Candidatus Sumerlaeota bacterium]|nr:hypothetical protein [Candidatus Sumerlaeota bacterium]
MYKFMIIVAVIVAILFMAVPMMLKSGSDEDVANRELQVQRIEREIMTALRAQDHARVRTLRTELFELFERGDAEANQIYDNILARYNHERSTQ